MSTPIAEDFAGIARGLADLERDRRIPPAFRPSAPHESAQGIEGALPRSRPISASFRHLDAGAIAWVEAFLEGAPRATGEGVRDASPTTTGCPTRGSMGLSASEVEAVLSATPPGRFASSHFRASRSGAVPRPEQS